MGDVHQAQAVRSRLAASSYRLPSQPDANWIYRKMKRILLVVILAACSVTSANAQKTKTQMTTEINTNLPSTGTGAITAATMRTTLIDLVNSYLDITPDSPRWRQATANDTILNTDCYKTVQEGTGSSGFFTVTFPSVSGFPTDCVVDV